MEKLVKQLTAIIVVTQIAQIVFAFLTSKEQTKKIIKHADKNARLTVWQTILLGIAGAIITAFQTGRIMKSFKKITNGNKAN